jgi:CubicO group peptidase (beta-lactamase class C family)
VGKAQAEGLLSSIDAPLPVLLPQYFDGAAAAQEYADKRTMTLRQLLQMRSGLAFDEDTLNTGGYGGEELLEENLTAMALGFPVAHPPGESWNYSTLDTQLISAIVQEAAGEPLAAFTAAHLFAPLGVETFEWSHDGAGTTIGGQNLSMTPRDMAKLGLLYLHGGAWEGNQLVPNEWVTLSLTPQNERLFFPPSGQVETIDWYGYHWYTWKGEWFFGYRSFQAAGYGGQQVLVFPELNLIIVTTANLAGATPDTDVQQRTALNELILEVIFPALADVELGLPASP